MPPPVSISHLAMRLRFSDRCLQNILIKKIVGLLNQANRLDMERLIETVINVDDKELQVKLFSVLSGYLLSKGKQCDVILSCNRLYEILNDLLNNGLSHKTTTMLNFISSLLYNDDDCEASKRSLVPYALNKLRVSGCLVTMSVLFTNTMMYQDTWKAVCHALAESCKGCEQNQTYCSHLIPVCIQKVRERHVDAFLVLLSLTQNHERNIDIFIEANGLDIFSREFLQLDSCLQLLNSLVEQSLQVIQRIREIGVLKNLRDLLDAYGPVTQIGQWATIILYHMDVQLKRTPDQNVTNHSQTISNGNLEVLKNNSTNGEEDIPEPTRDNPNDTGILLKNIVKEIYSWQSLTQTNNIRLSTFQNNMFFKDTKSPLSKQFPDQVSNKNKPHFQVPFRAIYEDNNQDMSFSFINEHLKEFNNIKLNSKNYGSVKSVTSHKNANSNLCMSEPDHRTSIITNGSSSFKHKLSITHDVQSNITYSIDFKPNFMSTPKHKKITGNQYNEQTNNYGDYNSHKIKRMERKRLKKKNLSTVKQVKNRTMGSRFFDVINESCTTLVKTVKNMFRPKKETRRSLNEDTSTIVSSTRLSCSFSFTKYMKERDAILAEGKKIKSGSDKESSGTMDTCKTCNDTLVLEHKLANDEQLKNTFKKLKQGINLYGCDFRKISRTMWPREKYMTHRVLKQLYRKLLLKGKNYQV